MTWKIKKYVFEILLIGLILCTWLPHIFQNYWVLELLSHFKLQYSILLTLLILFGIYLKRSKFWMLLLIATFVFNGSFIYPFYISKTPVSVTKEAFKITSINLLSSNTKNTDLVRYITKENPDFLILLEYTPRWKTMLDEITSSYPYSKIVPQENNFGIAIFSKIPIQSQLLYLHKNATPSILSKLTRGDSELTILSTHPVPPLGGENLKNRNQQFMEIAHLSKNWGENFVIIGDLNCSSFSPHFNKLVELAKVKDTRLGFGILPTWPASVILMQTTLDHCLVSEPLEVKQRSTGTNIGSDHLPITVTIGF